MSLKQKGIAGVFWTFLQQFSSQIIKFGVSLVLARLLMPKDFGTIALINLLIGVSTVIINSGLTLSLIRSQNNTEEDYSTVFWFNIIMSSVMYAVAFFAAPFFAEFYELPILVSIIRVFSIILIINSFGSVQSTLLTKTLNFKAQFKIQIPSLVISGIMGLLFAYKGFGVWTLVYMAIIQSTIQVLQLWFYTSWYPKFIFVKSIFKKHSAFGINLMFTAILDIIFQNIYTIVIGKYYNSTQLGFYDRANNLKELPVNNLSSALTRVTYPLLAEIQSDDKHLKIVNKKIMQLAIFVVVPILILMIVQAEPLVRFLLTEKWMPVVPYIQILAIGGVLQPIHSYNINILQIKGRTRLVLYAEIIKKIVIIAIVLICFRLGIVALLWGQVFISFFSFFINSKFGGKLIDYSPWEQIKDLFPILFLVSLIGGFVYILDLFVMNRLLDWARLLINSLILFTLYISVSFIIKLPPFLELKKILKKN